MTQATDYLENQIIDHILRSASFTKPSTIYIGLFTALPTDTGGGTEVSAGGYARVQVGPSDSAWNGTHGNTTGASSGTSGLADNAADVTFGTPSANWGTIVGYGVFDASTSGNLLIYGALTANKTVNNGDPAPKFSAGDLDITVA